MGILIVLTFRTYFYPARKALTMIWRIIGWKMFASAFLVMVPDVMQRLGYGASVPIDRPLWEKLIGAGSCIIFGSIYHTTRIRERFHAFLSQHGHEVNVAMLLAGFLGGNVDEEAVRKDSVRLFRYVHLSDLTFKDMLDATSGARSQEVFLRSQPALLGEIDAFVSHSWHDDPKAKWDALQAWCKGFYEKFGRQPKLWLDFCCIDQNNIEANLRCLPVWLSACHQILIIAGPTYVQRLWCAIELFVFVSIHGFTHGTKKVDEESGSWCLADILEVRVLGQTEEEHISVCANFSSFDARECECFDPEDKHRLLGIVEAGSGTTERFNAQIRGMLGSLQDDSFNLSKP